MELQQWEHLFFKCTLILHLCMFSICNFTS